MNLQHLNLTIYFTNPAAAHGVDFISIFNGWIREQATDELLVDVADYRHVYNGPGVVLIGHEANYGVDEGDGRPGLLYSRKAQLSGSNAGRLAQAARALLTACLKIEREQGLAFAGQEIRLVVNDRLLAPNDPHTRAAILPDLESFFGRMYGGGEYSLDFESDPRERFGVTARAAEALDVERLLSNLAVEPVSIHA